MRHAPYDIDFGGNREGWEHVCGAVILSWLGCDSYGASVTQRERSGSMICGPCRSVSGTLEIQTWLAREDIPLLPVRRVGRVARLLVRRRR